MRNRAPALVVVVAFAVVVAALAVFAARSDDHRLVKLPVASFGGAAADEAGAGVASARSSLAYPVPVEYRVEGTLADLPSSAPAYRLGSVVTADAIQRLAVSLGLKGEVGEDGETWVVRSGERELRVQRFGGLPWYLGSACPEVAVSFPDGGTVVSCSATAVAATPIDGGGGAAAGSVGGCAPDAECVVPDRLSPTTAPAALAPVSPPVPSTVAPPVPACPPGTMCTTGPDPASTGSCAPNVKCVAPTPAPVPPGAEPAPAPDRPADVELPIDRPPRPADLPSEEEARALARAGFARLGVGTEGLVIEDGWFTWEARVEARVDGVPVVGLGTSLSIGAGGEIVRGNGYLASPDRIGDYPLVGVEAGLKRLTTGFGFGAGPRTMVATDQGAAVGGAPRPAIARCDDSAENCSAPTLPTPPQPTSPEQVPPPPTSSKPTFPEQAPLELAPEQASPEPVPVPVPPTPAPVVQVVTGVHLALLQVGDFLVPAYEFELADGGGTVPVPAVTDEWLDQQGSTLEK